MQQDGGLKGVATVQQDGGAHSQRSVEGTTHAPHAAPRAHPRVHPADSRLQCHTDTVHTTTTYPHGAVVLNQLQGTPPHSGVSFPVLVAPKPGETLERALVSTFGYQLEDVIKIFADHLRTGAELDLVVNPDRQRTTAGQSHLDLSCAPYGLYGVKYIDLVSPTPLDTQTSQ